MVIIGPDLVQMLLSAFSGGQLYSNGWNVIPFQCQSQGEGGRQQVRRQVRAGLTQGTSPELTDPLGTVLRVHDICRTHGNVLIFFFFL